MCFCLFQEVIVRDSSGWDLGPDLDHFSSRTRQVLQYMNPNKINMDLLVDLMDYLGTTHHQACFRQHQIHVHTCFDVVVCANFFPAISVRQIPTICRFGWSRSGVPPRSGSHPAAV